jgi:hypothetical protein
MRARARWRNRRGSCSFVPPCSFSFRVFLLRAACPADGATATSALGSFSLRTGDLSVRDLFSSPRHLCLTLIGLLFRQETKLRDAQARVRDLEDSMVSQSAMLACSVDERVAVLSRPASRPACASSNRCTKVPHSSVPVFRCIVPNLSSYTWLIAEQSDQLLQRDLALEQRSAVIAHRFCPLELWAVGRRAVFAHPGPAVVCDSAETL